MPPDSTDQTATESSPPPEHILALHEHVVSIMHTFYEWRHRVMVFTFTVTSALVAVGGWMWDKELGTLTGAPFLMAAWMCLVAIGLDWRNQQILYRTYDQGIHLARELGGRYLEAKTATLPDLEVQGNPVRAFAVGGPYEFIQKRGRTEWFTYHRMLKIAYGVLGIFLVLLAVKAFRDAPAKPGHGAMPAHAHLGLTPARASSLPRPDQASRE
jgi:hypothetical protein